MGRFTFERLLQAQSKCINILYWWVIKRLMRYIILIWSACPATIAGNLDLPKSFTHGLRASTREVTDHLVVGEPISRKAWAAAKSPAYMIEAARNLDKRHFFTDTVRIYELVNVPAVGDAVASQYSEGCFTSWDPDLNALIATVTGSARPVARAPS
jgi:hypothetical protein